MMGDESEKIPIAYYGAGKSIAGVITRG